MAGEHQLGPEGILALYAPNFSESEYFQKGRLDVYAPHMFKQSMLFGNPESQVGVATGWSNPQSIVPAEAMDGVAIAASLRTPAGVNLLLHNLARNPHIRTVAIWANGTDDDTERGILPRAIINALWQNGVDDDRVVSGTKHKVSPELARDGGLDIIRKIIKNVELVDWSDQPRNQLGELARQIPKKEPYMDPHQFGEYEIEVTDTMPSELVGITLRDRSGFSAWLRAVGDIIRYGRSVVLDSGQGTTVRELPFLTVVLDGENPFAEIPQWASKLNFEVSQESLRNYYLRMLRPEQHSREIFPGVTQFHKDAGRNYHYAELLWAFPRSASLDAAITRIGELGGISEAQAFLGSQSGPLPDNKRKIVEQVLETDLTQAQKVAILAEIYLPPLNQVQKAIDRLRTTPQDADKTFILWDPYFHGNIEHDRPCFLEMGLIARNGVIDGSVTFRTQDWGKSWLDNSAGAWHLVNHIAEQSGHRIGKMIYRAESAHIYMGDLNDIREVWERELVNKKPSQVFNDADADPRGSLLISTNNGQIHVTLTDPESGLPIYDFEVKTAREAQAHIRHHGLISQVAHGLDIGDQLRAAELSLQLGLPYTQDRPQDLHRGIQRRLES